MSKKSDKAKQELKEKADLILGEVGKTTGKTYKDIIESLTYMRPIGGEMEITVMMELKDDNLFKPDEKCKVTARILIKLDGNNVA